MIPRPYMSPAELVECIPFSEQALKMLRDKGEHVEGRHFFKKGRKVVYKWAAIEEWIEARRPAVTEDDGVNIPLYVAGGRGR